MFRVIKTFSDLADHNHIYKVGDVYPRNGVEPDENRIAFLLSNTNLLNAPVIEQVLQQNRHNGAETAETALKQPEAEQTVNNPSKRRKRLKTANKAVYGGE